VSGFMLKTVMIGAMTACAAGGLVMSLPVGSISTAGVVSSTSVPNCRSKQLTVLLGGLEYSVSLSSRSRTASQEIMVKNSGGTCKMGGVPKIGATGVEAKSAIAANAKPASTKHSMFTLKRGQMLYSVLLYWWVYGSNEQWKKSCAPATATGFEISMIPYLEPRHVKYTIGKVCTKGTINMSVEPLRSTPW